MPNRADRRAAATALAVGVLLALTSCGSSGKSTTGTTASGPTSSVDLSGVQTFTDLTRNHVQGMVNYPQVPPVGGDHAPVWQNCGYYSQAIVTELGVHSMEHGAVWVTYLPDLPADQVAVLEGVARTPYVLVSPYPGLPSPVVASAWGAQLRLPSATDPRLAAFVQRYANGPQTPEPGAPCRGAVGTPGA